MKAKGAKWALAASVACVALVLGSMAVRSEQVKPAAGTGTQHLVIKICDWDGVVPKAALDGFTMPAGKWADFQRDGWRIESYLVAPNDDAKAHGLYAVLAR